MQFEYELAVNHSPVAIIAALGDENFIRFATERGEAELTQVDVNRTPEGDLTTVVRRTVPTDLIPAQVRALVGSNLEIRQVDAWSRPLQGDDGPRFGTTAVEVSGASVQASGRVQLEPTADGATLNYEINVRSTIPLFGSTVEQKVAAGLAKALDVLKSSLADWLDRNPL